MAKTEWDLYLERQGKKAEVQVKKAKKQVKKEKAQAPKTEMEIWAEKKAAGEFDNNPSLMSKNDDPRITDEGRRLMGSEEHIHWGTLACIAIGGTALAAGAAVDAASKAIPGPNAKFWERRDYRGVRY